MFGRCIGGRPSAGLGLVTLLAFAACGSAPPAESPLLAVPTAETSFSFTEPAAWRVANADAALELVRDSKYEPPFRSPHSIALVRGATFRDFQLDVDVKQTGPEYAHRDLCFFFGFESRERFYYVHLASTPDANAHNVFLVDHAARRNLLPPQSTGVTWGNGAWHHVRIVRNATTGSIRVFFDDMEHAILEAVDTTISAGRIGVGSFDDTGMFKNLAIRGERTEAVGEDFPAPIK